MNEKFKVGDFVRPVLFDAAEPPFEVKEIFTDGFGDVLLRESGGYGYGAHYCKKVTSPCPAQP